VGSIRFSRIDFVFVSGTSPSATKLRP
jgi:hypothetical protein